MGKLFNEVCVGPVVVIDDQVEEANSDISKLIKVIEDKSLPVLKFKGLAEVEPLVEQLHYTNFILVDWNYFPQNTEVGVKPGAEAVEATTEKVIELIKRLQERSLAPVFIVSQIDTEEIQSKLKEAGLEDRIFVAGKVDLLANNGDELINRIETWISENPHVYLSKWWTRVWLESNATVFWELFKADPKWPLDLYEIFAKDKVDPTIALIETISGLAHSGISVGGFRDDIFSGKGYEANKSTRQTLYKLLVYKKDNIDKDVRPGDIFKDGDKYYLNVRPACDTTKRTSRPTMYLIEGKAKNPKDFQVEHGYQTPIAPLPYLYLYNLPNDEVVVFNKRNLEVRECDEAFAGKKICRVTSEFAAQYVQGFASFIGRFGVPSYPPGVIFSEAKTSSETKGQIGHQEGGAAPSAP